MQSKNNKSNSVDYLEYHNCGVIFTAIVLALIQVKILYWNSNLKVIPYTYPVLIFLGVIFLYSLDHYWDSKQHGVKAKNKIINQRFNAFLILASGFFGILIFSINITSILYTFWWIPLSLVLLYSITLVFKVGFRGLKELLISAAVTSSLFLLFFNVSSFVTMWPNMLLLFIICMQNLIVFAFFEKPKDEYFNNKTLLTGLPESKAKIIVWILLGLLWAIVVFLQIVLPVKFIGAWIIGLLYLFFLALNPYFKNNTNYRIIADGLLLLLLF